MSDISRISEQMRRQHQPRHAALDESEGEDGMVCGGHGIGYPPPWPCTTVRLLDALDACGELEAIIRDLAEADPICAVEYGTADGCTLCDAEPARLSTDKVRHAEDCPCRRAREWVAEHQTG